MSNLGWQHLTARDRQLILDGLHHGRAHGGPFHVELHPADRCNIDCFFCSTAAIRDKDQVSLSRLEELFAELKDAGTRSLRLAGGGEPLFHKSTKQYLAALKSHAMPIENITTNGVLLDEQVIDLISDGACDEVTVSLNTADAESYASMMKTTERNFTRVVDNVRRLKAAGRTRRVPRLKLQFLVWKGNFRTIPAMYTLAREVDADAILFNGLSHLPAPQMLDRDEIAEMLRLYESVIRDDEYRRIESIESYELDISAELSTIHSKLHQERVGRGIAHRLRHYLTNGDFTLGERLRHSIASRRANRRIRAAEGLPDFCLIGWHSMVIRATGTVAPCCILQGKSFGNIYEKSVREIWYGEAYERFRQELSEIMRHGDEWAWDPARHRTVNPQCASSSFGACPVRSYYYAPDVAFRQSFGDVLAE
jgi:MoaA/NifB/PqqE/SkfB family radical SAM enzyme